MNEEKFNLELRKFLKKVGITAQREIEKAVWSRIEAKTLKGDEVFKARMILEVADLDLVVTIDEEIGLE